MKKADMIRAVQLKKSCSYAEIARELGCRRQNITKERLDKMEKQITLNLATGQETAKALGITYQSLKTAAETGIVPSIMLGKQRRYNIEAVKKAIETKTS